MKGFINLDSVVEDWAWRLYDKTATSWKLKRLRNKEKKNPRTHIGIRIDWSGVTFHDNTDWPQLAEGADKEENQNTTTQASSMSSSKDKADSYHAGLNILFQTKFTNNTNGPQEYTMKTEKTTRSAATVEVENGFTHGIEMSVALKTPCEIFEANAGYKREMSIINTKGETIEEELHWGVESQIHVEANHVAEAMLVVNEKKYSGQFNIETGIQGYVQVTFTNIRDNNSLVKAMAEDIACIVEEYVKRERRKGDALDFVEINDGVVTIKTKGQCKFRFGINQEVKVNQKPLTC